MVAKIGPRILTVDEVQAEFARIPPQFAAHFSAEDKKEQFVRNLVDRILFAMEARQAGFLNRPEVQAKIEDYIDRTLYAEYIKHITADAEVGEEQALSYYTTHPEEFTTPERVHARHILLRTEEEARQVKTDLAAGAAWDDLARERSIDRSNSARGGDLGVFARGRMVPEFDELAFSLPAGQVGEPVETRFGWHVIRVDERKPPEQQSFEEVKGRVTTKLVNDIRKSRMDEAREALTAKHGAEVYVDTLTQIKVAAPASPAVMPPGRADSPPVQIRIQPPGETGATRKDDRP